jgi:hypothetical protein
LQSLETYGTNALKQVYAIVFEIQSLITTLILSQVLPFNAVIIKKLINKIK